MPAPRYETIVRLASGGMATVWIGTVRGALGFRQLVAIKKPHPHLLTDPGFRTELIAEARLASMIHHANVVDVRDVEIEGDSISLVMDFIEGASVGDLLVAAARLDRRIPPRVAVRIVRDACAGLHAAHELVDERDRPVGLVHRDISPQNVLVGTDGIARVTDFGVAKFARKNAQSTSEGSLKGKLAYMAPEYVRGETIDRRFDVFAMGVVLWELLTGRRLFRGENEAETLRRLLDHTPPAVSSFTPELAPLDDVVACALAKNVAERFQNAAAMGAALEAASQSHNLLGSHTEVAATVTELFGASIDERRAQVRAKLAHEPSVASLMGVSEEDEAMIRAATSPPNEQPAARRNRYEGPTLETPAITKPASTPKMGGEGAAVLVDPPRGALPPTTLPLTNGVPTTVPMTAPSPHDAQSTAPTAATVAPMTLASAPEITGPPPPLSRPSVTATSPNLPPPFTLRSDMAEITGEGRVKMTSGPPGATGTASHLSSVEYEVSADHALAASAIQRLPPRRSLVPFLLGALITLSGVAVFVVVARLRSTETATNNPPSTTLSASGVPSVAPAISSTPATPDSAPTAPAPPSSSTKPATTSPHRLPKTATTRSTPSVAPTPTTTPPKPTSTTKQPPPNPYP